MPGFPGKPKRPPVDPNAGDGSAPATPRYVIEPAQPVTTVSPPPPQPRIRKSSSPLTSRSTPAPLPVIRSLPVVPPAVPAPAPKSAPGPTRSNDDAPSLPAFVFEPAGNNGTNAPLETLSSPPSLPAETFLPSTPTPLSNPIPASATVPYAASAALPEATPELAPEPSIRFASSGNSFDHLGERIVELYEQVNETLSDSPTVGDFCMNLLKLAREALLKQDYASAEFYIQSVEAKLKRSATSMKMSRSPKIWLLYIWQFTMLLLSALFIALTYTGSPRIFGITVAPEFLVLMRGVGWGGVGGVIGALYNLPWFIQFREYDPAYNMNYVVRPLQGLLIGAILFLLSQAGVLAGSVMIPGLLGESASDVSLGPVFLYLLAALAGFKQEYVWEFLDNILKSVFRVPQLPSGLQTPVPPSGISTYDSTRQ